MATLKEQASISFSAQFGGRYAAEKVLPHFRALKAAAKKHRLPFFPFESLAFILRVDGDISTYGQAGVGNLDFDRQYYVSVDIVIKVADYENTDTYLTELIAKAIKDSVGFMQRSDDAKLEGIDFPQLENLLDDFCSDYV